MAIDGRVEKQTVVQPDHGLFPSLEQEGSADTCYGAGDPEAVTRRDISQSREDTHGATPLTRGP